MKRVEVRQGLRASDRWNQISTDSLIPKEHSKYSSSPVPQKSDKSMIGIVIVVCIDWIGDSKVHDTCKASPYTGHRARDTHYTAPSGV